MATVNFLLASIVHRLGLGMISFEEARCERQHILGIRVFGGHQPVQRVEEPGFTVSDYSGGYSESNFPPPMTFEEAQAYNRAYEAKRIEEWNASVSDWHDDALADIEPPPDVHPMITGILDLDDYGSGLVPEPEAETRERREKTDAADYAYSIRDRVEYAREREMRTVGDLTQVIGASYPASSEGSKEWLDDQAAQARIDYALLKRQAKYFWVRRGRMPRSFTSLHDDPQLKWLVRRQQLLRIQFNVRRKCEALGVNPDIAGFRLYQAPALDAWADDVISHIDEQAAPEITEEQRERYLDAYEYSLWAYGRAHRKPMPDDDVEDLRHELAQACLHELEFWGQRIPAPERQPLQVRDLIPVVQPRVPRHALMLAVPRKREWKYTESLVKWISEKRRAA